MEQICALEYQLSDVEDAFARSRSSRQALSSSLPENAQDGRPRILVLLLHTFGRSKTSMTVKR